MPTHGRSLSSGSIDELTLKNDSACLALRREEEDGMRSVYVCVGVVFERSRECGQMLSAKCVYLFVWLNGSEVGWKGKVFKGHGCVSAWVLLHCYSYQYSAVIPDLVRQTTKALLSPSEKSLYSPPEGTVH